jgi:Family of unknown function (DUF6074)/Histidine kinase-, DNA gyrase B-, and HSP90-like ATPase
LLEFCSQRELIAQTGQAVETWPLIILKELVDNALDEAEEAGIAPVIAIEVETSDQTITITDNGRGLRPEVVADLIDFTHRTSSKEAYSSPTRGQQGNALSTILPMPFALAEAREEPGHVLIEACGIAHKIGGSLDPIRQEPAVSHRQAASLVKTGTRIVVRLPDSAVKMSRQLGAIVLPFPLARRKAFITKQAARMAELTPAAAESWLKHIITKQADTMGRKGVAPDVIEREYKALESAIRGALWKLVLGGTA